MTETRVIRDIELLSIQLSDDDYVITMFRGRTDEDGWKVYELVSGSVALRSSPARP